MRRRAAGAVAVRQCNWDLQFAQVESAWKWDADCADFAVLAETRPRARGITPQRTQRTAASLPPLPRGNGTLIALISLSWPKRDHVPAASPSAYSAYRSVPSSFARGNGTLIAQISLSWPKRDHVPAASPLSVVSEPQRPFLLCPSIWRGCSLDAGRFSKSVCAVGLCPYPHPSKSESTTIFISTTRFKEMSLVRNASQPPVSAAAI